MGREILPRVGGEHADQSTLLDFPATKGSVYRTFYDYPGELLNLSGWKNLGKDPDDEKAPKDSVPRIGLILGATGSERVMGTFFNSAHGGVVAAAQDGAGPNAVMVNHGLEGDIAFRVDAVGENGVFNINASSHPLGGAGIHLRLGEQLQPHHKVVFANAINFGVPVTGFDIRGGQFLMEGGYLVTNAREHMIHVENGQGTIQGVYFRRGMEAFTELGPGGRLTARYNAIRGALLPGDFNTNLDP
ncbi:MAG: hypothetical protein HC901_04140 [Bdellovibrionaceae bacterium]|nr:hypothetical protein [Pseudobdellovibrionaceae bacterium]